MKYTVHLKILGTAFLALSAGSLSLVEASQRLPSEWVSQNAYINNKELADWDYLSPTQKRLVVDKVADPLMAKEDEDVIFQTVAAVLQSSLEAYTKGSAINNKNSTKADIAQTNYTKRDKKRVKPPVVAPPVVVAPPAARPVAPPLPPFRPVRPVAPPIVVAPPAARPIPPQVPPFRPAEVAPAAPDAPPLDDNGAVPAASEAPPMDLDPVAPIAPRIVNPPAPRSAVQQPKVQPAGAEAKKDKPALVAPVGKNVHALLATPAMGEEDFTGEYAFDRETMSPSSVIEEKDWQAEGYWALHQDPALDKYKGEYPWPQAHAKPWPHKEEFLKKLYTIECLANGTLEVVVLPDKAARHFGVPFASLSDYLNKHPERGILKETFRGYAPDRLSKGDMGSAEYYDYNRHILWPNGTRIYFKKYNVIPSRAFYRYVMNFPIT